MKHSTWTTYKKKQQYKNNKTDKNYKLDKLGKPHSNQMLDEKAYKKDGNNKIDTLY